MSDDLVKESDCFRLGTRPNDDDVNRANWLIDRQMARIEALEAEVAQLKIALNYFFLRDIEKPTNWEYERNLAEELARAALQDEDGE